MNIVKIIKTFKLICLAIILFLFFAIKLQHVGDKK